MKPGDLVHINRFGQEYIGVYLGLSPLNARSRWRFLINCRIIDLDLANKLVYSYKVLS